MAYTKIDWKDKAVEYPRRYNLIEEADGKVTLIPAPGEVTQEATPLNAENLNHMEQGIADAHEGLDGKAGKTHAHGNITNDGKIGTEADRFLVTGTGGAVGVKTKQEAVDLMGMSNPNILHNWDFNRPINQRETPAGVIASSGYFYDRWRADVGIIVEENGYVTVPVDVNLQQRIEGIEHAGKTYTYTCEDEAGVYRSVVIEFPTLDAPNYKDYNVDGLRVRTGILADQSGVYLHLTPQESSITFVRHKLELGTVSTLHLDPPMDWAVELPKCRRFYSKVYSVPVFPYYYTTSSIEVQLSHPDSMRDTSGTVTLESFSVIKLPWDAQTGFTASITNFTSRVSITFTKTGHGITNTNAFVTVVFSVSKDL